MACTVVGVTQKCQMSEADLQPEAKAAGIGVEILSRRMGGVLRST